MKINKNMKHLKNFIIESNTDTPDDKYKLLNTIIVNVDELNKYIGKYTQEKINKMVDNIIEDLDKLKVIDNVNKYNI